MGMLVPCPCEASRPGKLSRPDISLPERDQCERNRSRGGGAGPGSAPCFRGAHRGFLGQATLSTSHKLDHIKMRRREGNTPGAASVPWPSPSVPAVRNPFLGRFLPHFFLCDFCRPLFSHLKVNILPQMLSHVRGSDADCCGGAPSSTRTSHSEVGIETASF